MRTLPCLLVLIGLSLFPVDESDAQGHMVIANSFRLRSQRSRQLLGPFALANGAAIRVGDDEFTIEMPRRSGTLTHNGKTREFSAIWGIQPIFGEPKWLTELSDDLVLGNSRSNEQFIVPWEKIASITINERREGEKYLGAYADVLSTGGKTESFPVGFCGVEIEWKDSIARSRVSLGQFLGGTIKLNEPDKP